MGHGLPDLVAGEAENGGHDPGHGVQNQVQNLDGFDPNHLTAPGEMEELDRWAVTRLNALMERCFAAYDDYEGP